MFFKRIEMVGFKSFATRTVCDFIPGTTVIVGPNGCGKSNILDAVKWVLGEQAASQMRGKKMADVIFAGSASFKPLGVAQVTLTIDNRARILPMDFDEVQVTRRLFRSGESEYQINKVPCRLRDVHDLFLGTGIGKSAYSILEQGRVDQVVSAKPQERRFLIEEAAGISKFKIRKIEAQRKLERTDVDLARLNDLITEVDRQVGSLKRQASKAERYKALFDAHRLAEQELLILRSTAVGSRLAAMKKEMSDLGDKLMGLRTELAKRTAAEEAARDRDDELGDRISDENQALFDMRNHLTGCDGQIARLNDQIGAHGLRIDQITNQELVEIKKREQDLRLRREMESAKRDESENSRKQHEERYSELERQYAELEGTVRERTSKIEELSARANALRDMVVKAENESRMAEALIANHEQDRHSAEQILATLNEECLNHQIKREELHTQAETDAARIAAAQETLSGERDAQRERQETLGQKVKDIQQIAGRLNQSHSRLETLKELKASYEGYYQGVREVMVAAESGGLHGVLGVAANLIRANSEHEVAIEVALATHLQDIITCSAENARDAINYLKETGRGRATFLPLDRLQAQPLQQNMYQVLGRPGVIGVASEIVQYDKQIDIAVQFLLGSTIVVKDLDVGLELGRQGFRGRYVSLDGQLINPAGSMTGGRIQATGLMTREREIRDLAVTVERLERERTETQAAIEKLQIEITTAHHRIEAQTSEIDRQRMSQTGLLKDVEAAQRAADQAQKALDERRAQIEKIDQDVAAKRETIVLATARYAEAKEGLDVAEADLTAERTIGREQDAGILELGVAKAEARAEMNKARDRMQDALAQLQAIDHEIESVARLEEARHREIESLREQDVRINEQIERIKAETSALREQTEVMAAKISQDQLAREEVQVRMKQLTAEVEMFNRDAGEVDNKYREVELQTAELNANMTAFADQCRDKYQCELEALASQIGPSERDAHALQVEVAEMRDKIDRMGIVNMAALDEYQEQAKRLDFLKTQQADLAEAKKQLEDTIARLDETTRKLFHETFEKVRTNFIDMFRKLFNGGKADLILEAPEGQDPLLEGGIEIVAQPPGKKLQSITLLSGGEKAMTAVSLLFALFLYRPAPFCIMDEIDAPLDDANIERFKGMVREFTRTTQFMIITHNKITMDLADAIYGVTMEESGVSKMVSVRFEQAADLVDAV